jgi:hypothetical protein
MGVIESVTYLPEHPLPLSPVCTMGGAEVRASTHHTIRTPSSHSCYATLLLWSGL